MQTIIHKLLHRRSRPLVQKEPTEGYDLWAENYDRQPGNLMLDFDQEIFSTLLDKVEIKGKTVADMGCGTGRHWKKIFAKEPAAVEGFDVSAGMLNRLIRKFPSARVSLITDNHFQNINDATFDVIISTLTIAHIENIEEAITSWSRLLTPNGEIIITDFHPVALALGGKRTFLRNGQSISINNYIHPLEIIKKICHDNGFTVISVEERIIDERVKHYYQQKHAIHVYEQFKEVPMIYGIHLKRTNVAQ